jgi:hypothetical protein
MEWECSSIHTYNARLTLVIHSLISRVLYPSHSIHFVFPAAAPSGLTMLEIVLDAAEPGPLWLMKEGAEDWHMLSVCWRVVVVDAEGLLE